jgi:hypothetical protein
MNNTSKIILVYIITLTIQTVYAQDYKNSNNNTSTINTNARYEIVQSSLAAKWTFRIDRVCGNVSQLVSTQRDTTAWEPMIIYNMAKCSNDGKIRYQLFTSGLAARHTFLMNTENGKTWLLSVYKDKDGNEFNGWGSFDE